MNAIKNIKHTRKGIEYKKAFRRRKANIFN